MEASGQPEGRVDSPILANPTDRSGTLPLLTAQKQVVIVEIHFFRHIFCNCMKMNRMLGELPRENWGY